VTPCLARGGLRNLAANAHALHRAPAILCDFAARIGLKSTAIHETAAPAPAIPR
jgi:hypothetical protein